MRRISTEIIYEILTQKSLDKVFKEIDSGIMSISGFAVQNQGNRYPTQITKDYKRSSNIYSIKIDKDETTHNRCQVTLNSRVGCEEKSHENEVRFIEDVLMRIKE